jgi:hypothetical protein
MMGCQRTNCVTEVDHLTIVLWHLLIILLFLYVIWKIWMVFVCKETYELFIYKEVLMCKYRDLFTEPPIICLKHSFSSYRQSSYSCLANVCRHTTFVTLVFTAGKVRWCIYFLSLFCHVHGLLDIFENTEKICHNCTWNLKKKTMLFMYS